MSRERRVPCATQMGEISFCAYNTGVGWRQIVEKVYQNASVAETWVSVSAVLMTRGAGYGVADAKGARVRRGTRRTRASCKRPTS
jgi:hypothetical protein